MVQCKHNSQPSPIPAGQRIRSNAHQWPATIASSLDANGQNLRTFAILDGKPARAFTLEAIASPHACLLIQVNRLIEPHNGMTGFGDRLLPTEAYLGHAS